MEPVAGVAPVLAVAAVVAVQVAEAAVGPSLALGVIGPPTAPLARGLRGRARPAVLTPPEITVPRRPFGPRPKRRGLPPEPGTGVRGGPQAPMKGPEPRLLRVRKPVAGPSLEKVAYARDGTGAVVVGAHGPATSSSVGEAGGERAKEVPSVLRTRARGRRRPTAPVRARAATPARAPLLPRLPCVPGVLTVQGRRLHGLLPAGRDAVAPARQWQRPSRPPVTAASATLATEARLPKGLRTAIAGACGAAGSGVAPVRLLRGGPRLLQTPETLAPVADTAPPVAAAFATPCP